MTYVLYTFATFGVVAVILLIWMIADQIVWNVGYNRDVEATVKWRAEHPQVPSYAELHPQRLDSENKYWVTLGLDWLRDEGTTYCYNNGSIANVEWHAWIQDPTEGDTSFAWRIEIYNEELEVRFGSTTTGDEAKKAVKGALHAYCKPK